MLKLYSYFRSSASYRARIALHWKELPFEYIPVHLVRDGGHQQQGGQGPNAGLIDFGGVVGGLAIYGGELAGQISTGQQED
jgi:hypothetical protein